MGQPIGRQPNPPCPFRGRAFSAGIGPRPVLCTHFRENSFRWIIAANMSSGGLWGGLWAYARSSGFLHDLWLLQEPTNSEHAEDLRQYWPDDSMSPWDSGLPNPQVASGSKFPGLFLGLHIPRRQVGLVWCMNFRENSCGWITAASMSVGRS